MPSSLDLTSIWQASSHSQHGRAQRYPQFRGNVSPGRAADRGEAGGSTAPSHRPSVFADPVDDGVDPAAAHHHHRRRSDPRRAPSGSAGSERYSALWDVGGGGEPTATTPQAASASASAAASRGYRALALASAASAATDAGGGGSVWPLPEAGPPASPQSAVSESMFVDLVASAQASPPPAAPPAPAAAAGAGGRRSPQARDWDLDLRRLSPVRPPAAPPRAASPPLPPPQEEAVAAGGPCTACGALEGLLQAALGKLDDVASRCDLHESLVAVLQGRLGGLEETRARSADARDDEAAAAARRAEEAASAAAAAAERVESAAAAAESQRRRAAEASGEATAAQQQRQAEAAAAQQRRQAEDVDALRRRVAAAEDAASALSADCAALRRAEAGRASDDDALARRVAAAEAAAARLRRGHGVLAGHAVAASVARRARQQFFWQWSRWLRLRKALAGLMQGSERMRRMQRFQRWREFAAARRRTARTQRTTRALGLLSDRVLLRMYYDKLSANRSAFSVRRRRNKTAAVRIQFFTNTSVLQRYFRLLYLHRYVARERRRLQPIRQALRAHNGRLLLQRYFNKLGRARLAGRRRRTREAVVSAFERTTDGAVRARAYRRWAAFAGVARRARVRSGVLSQLGRLNTRTTLATFYERLRRLAFERREERRIDAAMDRAHARWRSEQAMPRLTTLEANITGLASQIPGQAERLSALEKSLNALLSDGDQGLEAHLADLRGRAERVAGQVEQALRSVANTDMLEAQLAGLRAQYDCAKETLDEHSLAISQRDALLHTRGDSVEMLRGALNELRIDFDHIRGSVGADGRRAEDRMQSPRRDGGGGGGGGGVSPAPSPASAAHRLAHSGLPHPSSQPVAELGGGGGGPGAETAGRLMVELSNSLSGQVSGVLAFVEERCEELAGLLQAKLEAYVEHRALMSGDGLTEQVRVYVEQRLEAISFAAAAVAAAPPPPIAVPVVVPHAVAVPSPIQSPHRAARRYSGASAGAGVDDWRNRLANVSPLRERAREREREREALLARRRRPSSPSAGAAAASPQAASVRLAAAAAAAAGTPRAVSPLLARSVLAHAASGGSASRPHSPVSSADTIAALRQRQRMRSTAFESVLSRTRQAPEY